MFRIPEVRMEIRHWFYWQLLTISLSELIDFSISPGTMYFTLFFAPNLIPDETHTTPLDKTPRLKPR